jgi:hypothetical protein
LIADCAGIAQVIERLAIVSLLALLASAHSSGTVERSGCAADSNGMRNMALGSVIVILGTVLLLGYLAITLAARTALAIMPTDHLFG